MKIIKNYLCNLIIDQRLSDSTILAVERDILVDYEQVVDIDSLRVTKIAEYYCVQFLLRPFGSD